MDVVTLGAALNGSKKYTDQVAQSLMGGVHYRGSVSYYDDLPSDPAEGDSYTVKYAGTSGSVVDGTEYTWGYDTDSQDYAWISFSKDAYSKAETDALLSGKQAALSQAQLNAVNSGIDSTKVEQIETNKNNILSIQQNVDDLELQIALLNAPVVVTPTWSNKQVNGDGTQGIYNSKRASTDDLIYVPEGCVATIDISGYSAGVYYFNENKEYTGSSFSALTVDGSEHRYFRFLFGGSNDIDISQANTICKITISKNATPANTAESIFSEVVGNVSAKVVLLGDSITQGVGSTGYVMFNKVIDGTTYSIRGNGPDYPDAGSDYQVGDYIYGDNGRKWYEALDGAGWAQLLKSYLEGKFGCTVKNYGCAGANAADLYAAIQASVIGNGYDIAVVMIGTNNRQDTSLTTYYSDLTRIIKSLESDDIKVIVLGGIPASVTNEEQFSHHMEDINHLALKCAVSCNVPFISMYSEISDYSEYTGHTIDELLGDSLHPNDEGYSVLFRLICKKIGIVPKRPGATW